MKKINKVLVANRGEIALRVMRACKEMGIKTVSVYSKADENSLHKNFADEKVCIGEAPASASYLNIPNLIAAAEITNADAIHPGYGFLSENANFAKVCQENNIIFIGPSSEIIELMGNKSNARETMEKAGIPTVPGTGVLANKKEALKEAKRIKYPVMLKASSGGGGKGMRICKNSRELEKNFELVQSEATINFGNSDIYLEKYIDEPHHIEVQLLGDKYGNYIHLGERDCSIQRRHQKIIEETPSPFLNDKTRNAIFDATINGIKNIGYEGAGTIEYLVDKHGDFYFMEMNTRIQVEHTISELYTAIDIVKEQINIANGEKLSYQQNEIIFRGHVIECRINAEDPFANFMPSVGKISHYHLPQGLGVRIDSHVFSGYEIPPNYDSMIAKLIVWGINREEAINRMKRSLEEIIIDGVKTTTPFHSLIIDSKDFKRGNFSTHFLENFKIKSK